MERSKIEQIEESFIGMAKVARRTPKNKEYLEEKLKCLVDSLRTIEESNYIRGLPMDPIIVNRLIKKMEIIVRG